MIDVRLACQRDDSLISKLHVAYIQQGFLTILGTAFLTLLYRSMLQSQVAFCVGAYDGEKLVGFVSGVTHVGKFYKEFLKQNAVRAVIVLLPKMMHPLTVKKMMETLFYPAKEESHTPDAELLSIVVDKAHQGKGVSRALFEKLVEEFKRRGCREFKVVVGSKLAPACKFYEKMGGVLHSEIEVHAGETSRVYVWEIHS